MIGLRYAYCNDFERFGYGSRADLRYARSKVMVRGCVAGKTESLAAP
jgi:hypothetical protein